MKDQSLELVILFNRYQVKRHDSVYGECECISETEAKNALTSAKQFLQVCKKKMKIVD